MDRDTVTHDRKEWARVKVSLMLDTDQVLLMQELIRHNEQAAHDFMFERIRKQHGERCRARSAQNIHNQ